MCRPRSCRRCVGQPTWMACSTAAPRMEECSPMTSRPASAFGRRRSPTQAGASSSRPRRSPGTALFSSATPAATPKAARATCSRSTPRPARSSGNSSSCPRSRATWREDPRAPRRSTRQPGTTRREYRSAAAPPGRPTRSTRLPGNSMCRSAIPGRPLRARCARAKISIPARSSCSTPRPGPTSVTSSLCSGIGTIGTSPARRA